MESRRNFPRAQETNTLLLIELMESELAIFLFWET